MLKHCPVAGNSYKIRYLIFPTKPPKTDMKTLGKERILYFYMLSGYMCKKNPNWVKTSKYLKIFLDTIPIFQLLSNSSFFEVLNDGQSVWVTFTSYNYTSRIIFHICSSYKCKVLFHYHFFPANSPCRHPKI